MTLGLRPTRPATGYGYLRLGDRVDGGKTTEIREVARYVEKPSLGRARAYVSDGKHLWNGGTFAFLPELFIETLHETLPEVAGPFDEAFRQFGRRRFGAALREAYDAVPNVSVDYGVMERAPRVDVVVGTFDWDDLGSWDAVARHRRTDRSGNAARGDTTLVDSKDCVVDAQEGHVALIGVSNLIVVRMGDTVLVAKRGRGEDVRDVVARLTAEGREDLLR